jgi:SAM-dependent methyltransferase
MSDLYQVAKTMMGGEVTNDALKVIADDLTEFFDENELVKLAMDAYDSTPAYYDDADKNPHTRYIIPELVDFMGMMPDDGLVLDLGCGHGRDSLYMVSQGGRESLHNPEKEYSDVPTKTLRVVPYDGSLELLKITGKKLFDYKEKVPLLVEGDFSKPKHTAFMHTNLSELSAKVDNTLRGYKSEPIFDGIWACTSLLIHTPASRIEGAIKYWSSLVKEDGIFAAGYFNPVLKAPVSYRLSQGVNEETGEPTVKVFMAPPLKLIRDSFAEAGMELISGLSSDYVDNSRNIDKPAFFLNDVYRKVN